MRKTWADVHFADIGRAVILERVTEACGPVEVGCGREQDIGTGDAHRAADRAPEQHKTYLGIYQFEKEKLMICIDEGSQKQPESKRPTEFDSRSGTSLTFLILKREKL